MTLADLCFETGLTSSKGEARRIISQGGIRVDNVVVMENRDITIADFGNTGEFIIRRGKKKIVMVELWKQ